MSPAELRHLLNLTDEGNFRRKVAAIIRDAKGHGYDLTVFSSLRTIEEQRQLVKKGYSKTLRSNHLPGKDGLSRAADIADRKLAWQCPKATWVMIGRLALTKGLGWGGLWGLPKATRKKLEAFLTAELPEGVEFDPGKWTGPLGWDTAHVEVK